MTIVTGGRIRSVAHDNYGVCAARGCLQRVPQRCPYAPDLRRGVDGRAPDLVEMIMLSN